MITDEELKSYAEGRIVLVSTICAELLAARAELFRLRERLAFLDRAAAYHLKASMALGKIMVSCGGNDPTDPMRSNDPNAVADAVIAELSRLRDENRWIPVKERLPEFVDQGAYYATETVLVDWQYQNVESNIERGVCKAGLVADDPMMWVNEENGEQYEFDDPDAPAHWRPLPPPPGGEG